MKMNLADRPASVEKRRSSVTQLGAQSPPVTAATMPDARAFPLAQLQLQLRADNSSQAAQLYACADMMAGRSAAAPTQRIKDADLIQGNSAPVQRHGDEELSQGKFAPVQRAEDEKLLPRKSEPASLRAAQIQARTQTQGHRSEPVQRAGNSDAREGAVVQRLTGDEIANMDETISETHASLGLNYPLSVGQEWVENSDEVMDMSLEEAMAAYSDYLAEHSKVKTPARMIEGVPEALVTSGRFIKKEANLGEDWYLAHITIEGYAPKDRMMTGAIYAHMQLAKGTKGHLKNYYLQLEPGSIEIGEKPINQAQVNLSTHKNTWQPSDIPDAVRNSAKNEIRLIAYEFAADEE